MKQTIWQELAKKLGREPTNQEACDEVKRILFQSNKPKISNYTQSEVEEGIEEIEKDMGERIIFVNMN